MERAALDRAAREIHGDGPVREWIPSGPNQGLRPLGLPSGHGPPDCSKTSLHYHSRQWTTSFQKRCRCKEKGATDRPQVNQIVRSARNKLRTIRRKGTRVSIARQSLTNQSAVANETHSIVTGP